jgi:hypothetical protein
VIEISFHATLQSVVQERIQYILAHQRKVDRPAPLNAAFVSVDTQGLATIVSSKWSDWGDGSERIAMPTLLQLAAIRGCISSEVVQQPLEDWVTFAESSLLNAEGDTPS